MNELAITVVGRDRPGIIADVSSALSELGLNLTDSTMTLLRGHFAMTLVCTGANGTVPVQRVRDALTPLSGQGGLLATVSEVPPEAIAPATGAPYVLTVHGADRLGIVAAVTRSLAAAGGNITDLTTRLTGAFYLLSAEVEISPSADVERLVDELDQVGARLGVEVNLRPAEADVL